MNWELLVEIGNFAVGIIGVIGGTAGVIFWRAARKEKEANAQSASLEAKKKEVDLVDDILHRFENFVREQMQRGEAVNKKELDRVEQNLGQQITEVQVENRTQNEIIAAQNDTLKMQTETLAGLSELVSDIKEYLNGGFAAFEESKHKPKGKKK